MACRQEQTVQGFTIKYLGVQNNLECFDVKCGLLNKFIIATKLYASSGIEDA